MPEKKCPSNTPRFPPGFALAKEPLVAAGQVINDEKLELLKLEHEAYQNTLTSGRKIYRSLAFFGMLIAMYTLSGFYILLPGAVDL